MPGLLRNTKFVSPSTGITYVIDLDGRATMYDDRGTYEPQGCECELDWNCPLHRGAYTAIERRNDEWASRETALDAEWGM